jgi:low-affinity inorganic phosphate transporter
MVFLLRRYWNGSKKQQRIHLTPAEREKKDGKRKPPFWTRTALILSAIGVSFSHGANDGQKGIGLIMLVLIGVAPAGFVVNMSATGYDIARTRDAVTHLQQYYQQHVEVLPHAVALKPLVPAPETLPNTPAQFHCDSSRAMIAIDHAQTLLANLQSYDDLTVDQRSHMRRLLMCVAETAGAVAKLPETSAQDRRFLNNLRTDLLETVEYAPTWIIVAVALALSLGTMIGWKRVAVTIGEKIGKKGMTYAQGVSAQMTAAVSIGIASYTGMPVSTTQVLSSAVAGTMLVDGGGVQSKTVKNIMLAWVLTLPISILLSGGLYWVALKFI